MAPNWLPLVAAIMLLMDLGSTLAASDAHPQNYRIKPVANAGLMFEPAAKAHFYTDECAIYLNVTVPSYGQLLHDARESIDEMRYTCRQMHDARGAAAAADAAVSNCAIFLANIEQQLASIVDVHARIGQMELLGGRHHSARYKRQAALAAGVIPWFLDFVTGQRSDGDRQQFEERFAALAAGTRDVDQRLGQHEMFVRSVFGRNEELARAQAHANGEFRARVQQLQRYVDGHSTRLTSLELQMALLYWQQYIGAELMRMQTRLRDFTDMIGSINAGTLHPLLVSEGEFVRLYRTLAGAFHNPMTDVSFQVGGCSGIIDYSMINFIKSSNLDFFAIMIFCDFFLF